MPEGVYELFFITLWESFQAFLKQIDSLIKFVTKPIRLGIELQPSTVPIIGNFINWLGTQVNVLGIEFSFLGLFTLQFLFQLMILRLIKLFIPVL